ncbi:MAG: Mrp/NBP35 family ATP-binding protein [Alphaproteobacteria bacterium]
MSSRPASIDDPAARRPAQWNREKLPHVKRILAVASGKGGVGKSTVTVSLAAALTTMGWNIGILDADIYGPSIPRMLGLDAWLPPEVKDGRMLPPVARGIRAMSIALITGDKPAVLRGPMISKALQQLLRSTQWGEAQHELDALLIDMPPGTGDIALSLAQLVPLDGAIIVTTPQQVAVADADKAAQMFLRVDVPLLGVIENMSWFETGGARHALFGEGGGAALAQKHGVPFLGSVPLEPGLGIAADRGEAYSGSALAQFGEIARTIAAS